MQPTTKILILGCLAWLVLAACRGTAAMQAVEAEEARERCAPLGNPPTAADIRTETGWSVGGDGTAYCHATCGDDRAIFYYDAHSRVWKGTLDRGPDGEWDFVGFHPENGTAGTVDLAAGSFTLLGPLEEQGPFPGMGVPTCARELDHQP